MNINWFTVIAQVINFLILVWLLKKFLYKPVLDAIDAREQKIVARLNDANENKEAAQKERDEYGEKNAQFEKEKKELMNAAIADTNSKKEALTEEARKEVATLRAKQQKSMEELQQSFEKDLLQKTQKGVFNISRKVLTDLAHVELEDQAVKVFIKLLCDLKDEEKKQLITALKSGPETVLVRSAFDIPTLLRDEIKKSVNELLGIEPVYQFVTAPEIVSGIELTANGYKLAWSIAAYLDSLEGSIKDITKEKTLPLAEPTNS